MLEMPFYFRGDPWSERSKHKLITKSDSERSSAI